MDYFEEAEKIIKYFDFNMSRESLMLLHDIKKLLNFDYNLIGSFFKDYLVIKNNFHELTESVFDDFLLYIHDRNKEEILREIKAYAVIYHEIIFEKARDKSALWGISTINSCYKIEFYPILAQVLYMYYNLKINSQQYNMMLKLIVDITIKCFANPDLKCNLSQIKQIVIENNITPERYAG